jgi:peptidoglycan/LPS O-acetylase OafA/YrhL
MRNARIDRLRGLAILTAALSHTPGFMNWDFYPLLTNIMALKTNGCFAVAIFFVVSGFLITRRLLTMRDLPALALLKTFYVQRVGRLAPCLLLIIAVAWVMSAAGYDRFVFGVGGFARFVDCIGTLQYNRCILQSGLPDGMNHLWSLSVEEVFYLFFPLFVLATRKHVSMLSMVLVGLVIYGPICRSHAAGADLYMFFGNFDLLAIGCLAALDAPKITGHYADLRWSGLLMIAVTFFGSVVTEQLIWPPTLVGIGSAIYLLGAVPLAGKSALIFRPVELAGDLSYEMYLFHLPILGAIVRPTYYAFYMCHTSECAWRGYVWSCFWLRYLRSRG